MEFYDGRSKGERPWFRRMMLLCMLWRSIFLAWGVECAGTHFLRLKHTSSKLQLAQTAQYLELRATISVELGNVYAQQGDPARAVKACEEAVRLARRAKDRFQEILGHNNAAYYALLQGNLEWAQEHITIGLALAEKHAVAVPRQWLYSTQGELALAQN